MRMKYLMLCSVVFFLTACSAPIEDNTIRSSASSAVLSKASLAGSFRCWQFNVDGFGGSCRTLSPIILNGDGTYSISNTVGTYSISGDVITLSESAYWGPGTIKEDGLQVYFNYTYNGKHYEVTYLKQ